MTPPETKAPPTRRLRHALAAIIGATAVLFGVGFAHPASAQTEGPPTVVNPSAVGIGETFTVSNTAPDCPAEVGIGIDGLGLSALGVATVDACGSWSSLCRPWTCRPPPTTWRSRAS